MKKRMMIAGSLVLASVAMIAAGCSTSSSDSEAKIDGMSPAEYREKAELSRTITTPAPGAKGRARRP